MVSNDALLRVTPKSAAAPVRNGERTGKFAQWEKQDLLAVAEEGVLLLTDLDGRTTELENPQVSTCIPQKKEEKTTVGGR